MSRMLVWDGNPMTGSHAFQLLKHFRSSFVDASHSTFFSFSNSTAPILFLILKHSSCDDINNPDHEVQVNFSFWPNGPLTPCRRPRSHRIQWNHSQISWRFLDGSVLAPSRSLTCPHIQCFPQSAAKISRRSQRCSIPLHAGCLLVFLAQSFTFLFVELLQQNYDGGY